MPRTAAPAKAQRLSTRNTTDTSGKSALRPAMPAMLAMRPEAVTTMRPRCSSELFDALSTSGGIAARRVPLQEVAGLESRGAERADQVADLRLGLNAPTLDAPEVVCPDGSRSEASPVAAAWVPLSNKRDDVEVKGFALPITGSHLLVRLCLPSSPLDIPLPSGLRLRPMSIRQRRQGVAHRPPNGFAFLMPKAKFTLESISECTKGMSHH